MFDAKRLSATVGMLADDVAGNFILLASALRQLQDCDLGAFAGALRDYAILPPVAMRLVQFDRTFAGLPVPVARLERIGWPALSVIAPYATPENHAILLDHAERHGPAELDAILRGELLPLSHGHMVFRLRPDEQNTLEAVLMAFGAAEGSDGLSDAEPALMELAWFVREQLLAMPCDDTGDGETDVELAAFEAGVLARLEERLDRLLALLDMACAERDRLQREIDRLTGIDAAAMVPGDAASREHRPMPGGMVLYPFAGSGTLDDY